MQLTLNIGYDQVRELTRQLTLEERERLVLEIQRKEPKQKLSQEEYHEMLMNFPVPSEEEIEKMEREIREMRNGFNRRINNAESWFDVEGNRQEARRLALECPVATEEEIEMQDEFRRMFRCRQS